MNVGDKGIFYPDKDKDIQYYAMVVKKDEDGNYYLSVFGLGQVVKYDDEVNKFEPKA